MAAVLKTAMARKRHRGFESHALRKVVAPQEGWLTVRIDDGHLPPMRTTAGPQIEPERTEGGHTPTMPAQLAVAQPEEVNLPTLRT